MYPLNAPQLGSGPKRPAEFPSHKNFRCPQCQYRLLGDLTFTFFLSWYGLPGCKLVQTGETEQVMHENLFPSLSDHLESQLSTIHQFLLQDISILSQILLHIVAAYSLFWISLCQGGMCLVPLSAFLTHQLLYLKLLNRA